MELIASSDSVHNVAFGGSDGSLSFNVTSPGRVPTRLTHISKQYNGQAPVEIGKIEVRVLLADTIVVRGKQIKLKEVGIRTSKRAFLGPDNHRYEWDVQPWSNKATLRNNLQHVVASYDIGSLKPQESMRPANFSIAPEAIGFLDEIFVTCIYMEQKSRQDVAASAAGGFYGGDGAAG